MENNLVSLHHATMAITAMEWLAGMLPQTDEMFREAKERIATWDPTFAD